MDEYGDRQAPVPAQQNAEPLPSELTQAQAALADAYQRIAFLKEQNLSFERRILAQELLMRQTDFDELTGLYNMRAFCRYVAERLQEDPAGRYMIVRWDIDNFKIFNDVLGTAAGERLLRDIGILLRCNNARHGIYARLEADHFAHCLPAAGTDPEELFENVFKWLASYPADFKLTPRVGVYVIDDPELDVTIMCDRALLALRSIKNSHQQRIAYYDESLREKLLEEQQLIRDMSAALKQEQFQLYFQPQYNYNSGAIIGAEALVRWNHPFKGLLQPDQFIPLLERNGFIADLDEYVWDRACRLLSKWQSDQGRLAPISVAVNISRLDIYNPRLCENIKSLVDKYRLPPSMLKLEITESAYIEHPQQLIEVVAQLQRMGFIVEMDDFGSGYSSLNTLKDVPVDILKLDMKFLSSCLDSTRGGSILCSILRMARWLELPVIAEGVETREQADYLNSLGCCYMQGYYFSRPMPAEEFEQLLSESSLGATDKYRNIDISSAAAFWDASAYMSLIFNSFIGGVAILEYRDGNVEVLRINDDFLSILGASREEYAGRRLRLIQRLAEEYRPVFIDALERAIATGRETECETLSLPLAEEEKGAWIRTRLRLLAGNDRSYIFYAAIENISERKEAELASFPDMEQRPEQANPEEMRRLARLASLDPLTGLLNRAAMEQRITEELRDLGPEDTYALFMIDLDNFKQVNDLLGHLQGDLCLSRVAKDIAKLFRSSDIVGRIGGDEFMAFLPRRVTAKLVRDKAAALVNALQFTVGGSRPIHISTSLGVVIRCGPADFPSLYRQADMALYAAKSAGKSCSHIVEAAEGGQTRENTAATESANAVQLKELLECMDAGVVLLELADPVRQIYVSPGYCKLTGCSPESYQLPRPLREAGVHPEDLPGLEAALREGAARGAVADYVFREAGGGQGWTWRHCRAVRIRYQASAYPVMVAVITNIDELKRSAQIFETMVQHAPVGMGIYEMGERIKTLFCNDRMLEITGLTLEEYARRVAQDATVIFHPDDLPDAYITVLNALRENRPLDLVYHANADFWRSDRLMRAQGVKIGEQNGNPLLLVLFSDLTSQQAPSEDPSPRPG